MQNCFLDLLITFKFNGCLMDGCKSNYLQTPKVLAESNNFQGYDEYFESIQLKNIYHIFHSNQLLNQPLVGLLFEIETNYFGKLQLIFLQVKSN